MSNHRQENLWGSVILGLRSKIRFFLKIKYRPWPQLLQGWLIRICGWQWDQRTARWPSGRAGWWKHMTKNTCICRGHMLLKQLLRAKQESRRQLNTMPCKMENWILDSRRFNIFLQFTKMLWILRYTKVFPPKTYLLQPCICDCFICSSNFPIYEPIW